MPQKQFTLPAVTVVTAGVPVPLAASEIYATDIIITADFNNAGKVYVGDNTVSIANGQPLDPGDSYVISTPSIRGTDEDFIVGDVYVDAANNGAVVRVAYIRRR